MTANAASSAEEDGEDMDDDDAEEEKPTVLKVKLFNNFFPGLGGSQKCTEVNLETKLFLLAESQLEMAKYRQRAEMAERDLANAQQQWQERAGTTGRHCIHCIYENSSNRFVHTAWTIN
ncbi:hypothetical protein DAPPUDRAFT_245464 [Daphnia pulex]|uniref:Uncharacterized protein n=1 Tax=Daphnia pulex TaxID=6669 RepID=E9GNE2_DAPPU|nr:hypothetical protein DAPPUDRAFT_245464 [Daphnia pulex]|eukprot:EFX79044.1 hypothetical protein DAPPUDRAFT_245464 [Daphnia pulex]